VRCRDRGSRSGLRKKAKSSPGGIELAGGGVCGAGRGIRRSYFGGFEDGGGMRKAQWGADPDQGESGASRKEEAYSASFS